MRITFHHNHPTWATDFLTEKQRLHQLLGPLAAQIEHIGSTSIPGLAAKPIVDIQIGLTSLEDFTASNGIVLMESAGYTYLPQFENLAPFRRLFIKDREGVRLNNLHLVAIDHPWFRRHLVFRDYLRTHPEACQRYEAVKRELAEREWKEMSDFAQAKTDIVLALEEEAFEHFKLDEPTRTWIRSSRV